MKDRIFWRLIRHARERRGLSQRAVPGIPQSRLSEWESGRVPVGEDTLAKLAAAFGKTLPAFLLEELALDALAQPAPPVAKRPAKIEGLAVVRLRGGEKRSVYAVCVDLDRRGAEEDWAALVRYPRLERFLRQTGATMVGEPQPWDGSRFGDLEGGTVERDENGRVVGTGLNRDALAKPGPAKARAKKIEKIE